MRARKRLLCWAAVAHAAAGAGSVRRPPLPPQFIPPPFQGGGEVGGGMLRARKGLLRWAAVAHSAAGAGSLRRPPS